MAMKLRLMAACLVLWGWGTPGAAPIYGSPSIVPARRAMLTVVFDNVPYREDLQPRWGFSCVVETPERTVLFDTGADAGILLSNVQKQGIDPGDIDTVFVSHIHHDHCGGLLGFLERNADVELYVPRGFWHKLTRPARRMGARVHVLDGPTGIGANLHSTGPLGSNPPEQSLIVETALGLVVVTGCSHPGVSRIVRAARQQTGRPVRLLIGGFHLVSASDDEIRRVTEELEAAAVKFVAPGHCTGQRATAALRDAFGDRCIASGLGRRLDSELLGTIVGVYAGPAAVRAPDAAAALSVAGIRHRLLAPEDVRQGDFKNCSPLLMPGGRTAEMMAALGDDGIGNIRRFVADGGGYVGICAGTYMAAEHVEVPGRPPGLGLLSIENQRRQGQGLRTIAVAAPDHPLAKDCPPEVRLWYQNGPEIGPGPGVRVVARYQDGAAAVVCGRHGKGNVVLFGPHPEGSLQAGVEPGKPGATVLLRNAVSFAGKAAGEEGPADDAREQENR